MDDHNSQPVDVNLADGSVFRFKTGPNRAYILAFNEDAINGEDAHLLREALVDFGIGRVVILTVKGDPKDVMHLIEDRTVTQKETE